MYCSISNLAKLALKIKRKQKPFQVSVFEKSYEKISFALIDKSVSFSPKIPYKLVAERSEANSSCLRNPFWR